MATLEAYRVIGFLRVVSGLQGEMIGSFRLGDSRICCFFWFTSPAPLASGSQGTRDKGEWILVTIASVWSETTIYGVLFLIP